MIPRDDVLRMAREAGFKQTYLHADDSATVLPDELFERFAAMVAAHVIARQPTPPMVVDAATIDPDLLRSMLAKAPPMPLVPMPTSDAVREAVLAEREAFAKELDAMADEAEADMDPSTAVANFRAKAAAIRARGAA